jgi:hypothetical protein
VVADTCLFVEANYKRKQGKESIKIDMLSCDFFAQQSLKALIEEPDDRAPVKATPTAFHAVSA